jgi:hypothetical protein
MDPQALIEQLLSAHRERGVRGDIRVAPAFHDLSPEARAEAFQLTLLQRTLEAAQDPEGLSSTARALLARLKT